MPIGEAVASSASACRAGSQLLRIVIAIQQKAGGNLSEALGNLSRVLRDRKKMKGKIKAMSHGGESLRGHHRRAAVVVVSARLPHQPDYIALLWTTPIGHIMLAGCGCGWRIGIFVMKKMINFDF